jgi:translation initiation factor IF-1
MESDRNSEEQGVEATVVELLPRDTYRVRLDEGSSVLAHVAGAGLKNFVRLRDGDRVRVLLSPHDPTRGRITRLL